MNEMKNKFDEKKQNMKDMLTDLSGFGKNVNTHVVSIKKHEQQFSELSSTLKPRQPDTLPNNTIQNLKND